jgi:hypothetical protein
MPRQSCVLRRGSEHIRNPGKLVCPRGSTWGVWEGRHRPLTTLQPDRCDNHNFPACSTRSVAMSHPVFPIPTTTTRFPLNCSGLCPHQQSHPSIHRFSCSKPYVPFVCLRMDYYSFVLVHTIIAGYPSPIKRPSSDQDPIILFLLLAHL